MLDLFCILFIPLNQKNKLITQGKNTCMDFLSQHPHFTFICLELSIAKPTSAFDMISLKSDMNKTHKPSSARPLIIH